MTYTWFMFFGLTLVGAAIAFMGDRLGRYMGKKRLTVFGLRPRHTALLFTVFAGMLISVTSLVTMSLISSHVWNALFRVDELLRDQRTLQRQNASLTDENRALEVGTARLQAAHQRWEKSAHEAEARAKQSREQLKLTLAQLDTARRGAASLQRELVQRRAAIRAKSSEVAGLRKRQQAIEGSLRAAQAQLKSARDAFELADTLQREARDNYRKANADYHRMIVENRQVSGELKLSQERVRETERRLEAAGRDLGEKQRALDIAQRNLDEKQRELAQTQLQLDTAGKRVAALEGTNRDLEATRSRLLEDQKKLAAQLKELGEQKDRVERALAASQGSEVLFPVGSELASQVIDGRQPRVRVREDLRELVARARAEAERAGAGGPGRPALTVKRRFQPGENAPVVVREGDEAIDTAAEEIVAQRTGVLAVVVAERNAIATATVIGHINVWQNRLVFHQGDTIAQKVLGPRLSTAQALEALVALLQGEVHATAAERKMIPRWNPTAGVPTPEFGQTPLAELVAAAEQVRKCRGGAVVQVVAPTDIWSADPMRVAFKVVPVGTLQAGRGRQGPVGAFK